MKNRMKSMRSLRLRAVLTATLAIASTFPISALGKDAPTSKGATKLLQLQRVQTVNDLASIKEGDLMVMSCSKCKTTTLTVIDRSAKGGQVLGAHGPIKKTLETHACPGCHSKIVLKGYGKARHAEIQHVCEKCGSESAYCCVMRKGEGPTRGMEKAGKRATKAGTAVKRGQPAIDSPSKK